MTVPGVYSPEQGLGLQGKQTGYRVFSVLGFGGGATWYLSKHGNVVSQHFSEAQAQSALRIAERKDTAMQAHVDKVIASDGVDDSRAVEVMAKAAYLDYVRGSEGPEDWWSEDDVRSWHLREQDWEDGWTGLYPDCDQFRSCARAALGALRALEGE